MVNPTCEKLGSTPSMIRELFAYGLRRSAEVGPEHVYDYSLGNPSIPAPQPVQQALLDVLHDTDPIQVHGYSMAGGFDGTRRAVAEDLTHRFGMTIRPEELFFTCGAAAALISVIRALTVSPDSEFVAIAPYFPEYLPFVESNGGKLVSVPADLDTFQISLDILEAHLTSHTQAVLVNSPNNPSGIVYSTPTIRRLAEILTRKSEEYGHTIFLISDEPYRDIIFSGTDSPYIANYYTDTITCYSFSKSISLPGERIGYLAVNPDSPYADRIIELCPQISRTTGHNGAASLLQHTVGDVCSMTSELSVYENNKNLLYQALTEYGYHCVEPGGTFYMFPRSPESDSMTFCKRAMEMDLMLVPGDNFGCPGHFRIAYCVPEERVKKALPVFRRLAESYR